MLIKAMVISINKPLGLTKREANLWQLIGLKESSTCALVDLF